MILLIEISLFRKSIFLFLLFLALINNIYINERQGQTRKVREK